MKAISKKDKLIVKASYDKEAIWYNVIGRMPNMKKSHFRTGVIRIAKKIRIIEISKLNILPKYRNSKGGRFNSLAVPIPAACGI